MALHSSQMPSLGSLAAAFTAPFNSFAAALNPFISSATDAFKPTQSGAQSQPTPILAVVPTQTQTAQLQPSAFGAQLQPTAFGAHPPTAFGLPEFVSTLANAFLDTHHSSQGNHASNGHNGRGDTKANRQLIGAVTGFLNQATKGKELENAIKQKELEQLQQNPPNPTGRKSHNTTPTDTTVASTVSAPGSSASATSDTSVGGQQATANQNQNQNGQQQSGNQSQNGQQSTANQSQNGPVTSKPHPEKHSSAPQGTGGYFFV